MMNESGIKVDLIFTLSVVVEFKFYLYYVYFRKYIYLKISTNIFKKGKKLKDFFSIV